MHWIDSLKKSSKADWLQEIKKDNPVTFQELSEHYIADGIIGLSFPTHEDLNPESQIQKSNNSVWRKGSIIPINNITESKSIIHACLQHGIEHLILRLNSKYSHQELESLLEGVFTEMLDVEFRFDSSAEISDEIISYLTNRKINYTFNENTELIVDRSKISALSFTTAEIINETEKVRSRILSHGTIENELILNIGFGNNFLVNIACFNALLAFTSKNKIAVRTEIQVDKNIYSNLSAHPLIALSNIGLAAAICNPSTILIYPEEASTSENLLQLYVQHLHILHILDYEAELHLKENPVAGSFYFEDLSSKILNKLMKSS